MLYDVKHPKSYYSKSHIHPDQNTGRQTNSAKWSVKRMNEPGSKQGMKYYISTTTEMWGWVMGMRGFIYSHDDFLRVPIISATRNVGWVPLFIDRADEKMDPGLNAQIKNLYFTLWISIILLFRPILLILLMNKKKKMLWDLIWPTHPEEKYRRVCSSKILRKIAWKV